MVSPLCVRPTRVAGGQNMGQAASEGRGEERDKNKLTRRTARTVESGLGGSGEGTHGSSLGSDVETPRPHVSIFGHDVRISGSGDWRVERLGFSSLCQSTY